MENLTIEQWIQWVKDTADYDGHGTGCLTYPTNSLTAEVGELNTILVRHMRKRGGDPALFLKDLNQATVKKLGLEAYDILHCLMFVINELGLSLEEVVQMGYEKLQDRVRDKSILASNRLREKSLVGKTVMFCEVPVRITSESLSHVEGEVSKEGHQNLLKHSPVDFQLISNESLGFVGVSFRRPVFYQHLNEIE